jgi:DNA-binding transcriptional ArsR family regulator
VEATLKAIADPRRRQILALVHERELSAGEIAAHFEVTRSAISQHLGVLRKVGLVSERRDGTRRMYQARREGLQKLKASLEEL